MKDLESVEIVYCESISSLREAFAKGLPKDVEIRSSSPALLFEYPQAKDIEETCDKDFYRQLHKTTMDFQNEIYQSIEQIDEYRDYSLLLARASLYTQVFFLKCCHIQVQDFEKNIISLVPENQNTGLTKVFNWDKVFYNHPNYRNVMIRSEEDAFSAPPVSNANFFSRLFLGGFESFIHRIGLKLTNLLPSLFNNLFCIARENELIIETSAHLIRRGVFPWSLSPLKHNQRPPTIDREKLENAIKDIIYKRAQDLKCSTSKDGIFNLTIEHFLKYINDYEVALHSWEKGISKLNTKRIIVGSNSPHAPSFVALSKLCKEREIPFLGFQHGVTHELTNDFHFQKAFYETNVSDTFITFNKKMSEIAQTSFSSNNQCIDVGLPKRYYQTQNTQVIPEAKTTDVAFISMNLYVGYHGAIYGYRSDFQRAQQEIEDLNFLNRLRKKIFYKTYPQRNRYFDQDPVVKYSRSLSNIVSYSKELDFRYLISNFRVFIYTQASSTLSWLILSDKPIVFIDNHLQGKMSEEFSEDMKKAVFVFEREKPNFYNELESFLNKDITEIEKLWNTQEKKIHRQKLIRKYFSSFDKLAGKKAAKYIHERFYSL